MSDGLVRNLGASTVEMRVVVEDLPDEIYRHFLGGSLVAWDIETSGLDWSKERIATCQLYRPGGLATLVRIQERVPSNLVRLLGNAKIKKIFHHAAFDLRFLAHHWTCEIR